MLKKMALQSPVSLKNVDLNMDIKDYMHLLSCV